MSSDGGNVYDLFRKVNMVIKYCALNPRRGMLDLVSGWFIDFGHGGGCVSVSLGDMDNETLLEWQVNMHIYPW